MDIQMMLLGAIAIAFCYCLYCYFYIEFDHELRSDEEEL